MAAISTQVLNYDTAAVPALTAASASDDFECPNVPGSLFAVYRNTNAATRAVLITMAKLTGYGEILPAPGAPGWTLAATTGELWIPLHPDYNNGSGRITITCSASGVNVTVGCVRIA
jgi:hypothetical protein